MHATKKMNTQKDDPYKVSFGMSQGFLFDGFECELWFGLKVGGLVDFGEITFAKHVSDFVVTL